MNNKLNELKISIQCKCGQITDFTDSTQKPIKVTGNPKLILDTNCIICGREIKAYISLQNDKKVI